MAQNLLEPSNVSEPLGERAARVWHKDAGALENAKMLLGPAPPQPERSKWLLKHALARAPEMAARTSALDSKWPLNLALVPP